MVHMKGATRQPRHTSRPAWAWCHGELRFTLSGGYVWSSRAVYGNIRFLDGLAVCRRSRAYASCEQLFISPAPRSPTRQLTFNAPAHIVA
jgi:hypothetical protein